MNCTIIPEKMMEQLLATAKNSREAVAFIAEKLDSFGARMTVPELCSIINSAGFRTQYGTMYSAGRGSYTLLRCAYHYYERQDNCELADMIAEAFTKPNGEYAYK